VYQPVRGLVLAAVVRPEFEHYQVCCFHQQDRPTQEQEKLLAEDQTQMYVLVLA